jgi:hypothetical protein
MSIAADKNAQTSNNKKREPARPITFSGFNPVPYYYSRTSRSSGIKNFFSDLGDFEDNNKC